jgi:hypothetical protein
MLCRISIAYSGKHIGNGIRDLHILSSLIELQTDNVCAGSTVSEYLTYAATGAYHDAFLTPGICPL